MSVGLDACEGVTQRVSVTFANIANYLKTSDMNLPSVFKLLTILEE